MDPFFKKLLGFILIDAIADAILTAVLLEYTSNAEWVPKVFSPVFFLFGIVVSIIVLLSLDDD